MSTKRIISALLALVLLLGCVPVTVLAEETAPAENTSLSTMESSTAITEEVMAASAVAVAPYARSNAFIEPEAVKVGGITASNVVRFTMGYTGLSNGGTAQASWNFQGAYTSCSFIVGYVSGATKNAEMTITADGVSIYNKVKLTPTAAGTRYTIPLTGVSKLTITMESGGYDKAAYGVGNLTATLAKEAPSSEPMVSDEFYDVTRISFQNAKLVSSPFDMGGRSYADGYHMTMGYTGTSNGETSKISFAFDKGYRSMQFDLAKYMNRGNESYTRSALLTIEADGSIVPGYNELELKWDDLVRPVKLDLNGVTQLTITINSIGYDKVIWALGDIQLVSDGKAHGILMPTKVTLTTSQPNAELNPRVYPSDAKNKDIKVVSDSSIVAAVDDTGLLLGRSKGTANITATTEDGGHTATCVATSKLSAAKFVPSRDGWGFKNYSIEYLAEFLPNFGYYRDTYQWIVGKSLSYAIDDASDSILSNLNPVSAANLVNAPDFLYFMLMESLAIKGMCHGMSVSSLLTYTKALPFSTWDLSQQGYEAPADIKSISRGSAYSDDLDLYLDQMIFACHLTQATATYIADEFGSKNNYEKLFEAVQNFRNTGKKPVVLRLEKPGDNHSIVPYDIVRTDEFALMFVYDCNLHRVGGFESEPEDFDADLVYIYFDLDKKGNVESWFYGTNYNSSNTDIQFADNLSVYADRIKVKGSVGSAGNYIFTTADGFTLSIGGKEVLKYTNGAITVDPDQSLAFPFDFSGGNTGTTLGGHTICLPEEVDFQLQIQDSSEETVIYYNDSSATVLTASGGSTVTRTGNAMTLQAKNKDNVSVRYNNENGSITSQGKTKEDVTVRTEETVTFQGYTILQTITSTPDGQTITTPVTPVDPKEEYIANQNGTITDQKGNPPKVQPSAPTATISNTSTTGKPKVRWKSVDGAAKYQVYRATSKSGKYSLMKTTTSTSYTNTTAKTGRTYYYYVVAVAADGTKSEKSSIVSRTCDLAQPTVTLSGISSTGKIKVSWKKIEGAKEYKVYRATSKNGKYTLVKTTTGTSYTNTSAKAGTTYYYKVKAIHEKESANSAYSSYKSRTCDLPRPDVEITLKKGDPRLTWDKIDGAKKYEIYRATSKNGTYKLMKTTTSTSYTNTTAKAGKTYYYKVKAIHSKSAANSAYSSIVSIKAK